jgi:hypothetical protein
MHRARARVRFSFLGLALSAALVVPASAQQTTTLRLFQNPPELQPVTPQRLPGQSMVILKAPSALAPQQDVTYDLNVTLPMRPS